MKIKVDGREYNLAVAAGTDAREWVRSRVENSNVQPTWETLANGGGVWMDWRRVTTVSFGYPDVIDQMVANLGAQAPRGYPGIGR